MLCLDKRVLAGLAAVAVAVWLWGPPWAVTALPLLVLLICPLSMWLMMRNGQGAQCQTGKSSAQQDSPAEREAEMVRLREEINTLKAQQARRESRSDTG